MILIEINKLPVPWRAHAGYGRRSYNPRILEREYYQWQIKTQYNQATPISGPLSVMYTYHMPVPKGSSKVRTQQMLNGVMHPIKRPDLDNLNKFLSDTLIGLVIEDDSQIVSLTARKIFGNSPKTVIKIESICH